MAGGIGRWLKRMLGGADPAEPIVTRGPVPAPSGEEPLIISRFPLRPEAQQTLDDAALRDLLYASTTEDLLLMRAWPPRGAPDATSYFGGLPTLPPRLRWPTGHRRRELGFVAQIDLGRLPDFPLRHLLPPRGALFFFHHGGDSELSLNGDWASVLHAEEDPATQPVRAASPRMLLPYGEDSFYHFDFIDRAGRRGLRDPETGLRDVPRVFPRWAMEFTVIRSFAERPIRDIDPASEARYRTLFEDAQQAAFINAFGPARRWAPPSASLSLDGTEPPPGYPFRLPTPGSLWLPDDAWPYAWLHVHVCALRLLDRLGRGSVAAGRWGADRFPPGTGEAALRDVQARIDAALDVALAWKREAAAAGHFAPVPADRHAAFRAWLGSIARTALYPDPEVTRIDPEGSDAPQGSAAHEAWRSRQAAAMAERARWSGKTDPLYVTRVNAAIERSIVDATDGCIAYAPDPAALLPAPVLDHWRLHNAAWQHRRWGGSATRHQLLGAPANIQDAPTRFRDGYVLLAQFDSDPGQYFMWGDMGVLQYWITWDDLRAGRFDRVVVTVEGH